MAVEWNVLTTAIQDDITKRVAFLKRPTKESSIHDIAVGIANKVRTELTGQGEGMNYHSLRLLPEFKDEDVKPVNEFPSENSGDEAYVTVVGVGERVNYQPGGVTEKFADVEIRVFISDAGEYYEVPEDENANEEIAVRQPATMIKMLGLTSDILDIVEENAHSIPFSVPKLSPTSDTGHIADDLTADNPLVPVGKYDVIQYWAKQAVDEHGGHFHPNRYLLRMVIRPYNFQPIEGSLTGGEKGPVDNWTILEIEFFEEGSRAGLVKSKKRVRDRTFTQTEAETELSDWNQVAHLSATPERTPKTTQDILVRQVTTDEGLLAPEGLAAGEISVEVRYQ